MKLKHAQLRKTTAFFTLTLYWRLPTPIYLTISNEKKQSIDRYTIIVERTENYIFTNIVLIMSTDKASGSHRIHQIETSEL